MNPYIFLFMEDYKECLLKRMMSSRNGNQQFIINRNEKGDFHSKYLGDRYEPAIIKKLDESHTLHYYLFNGDIKDCRHPFSVLYKDETVVAVTYYSSDRIENGEPVEVSRSIILTNLYRRETGYVQVLEKYDGSYSTIYGSNQLEGFTLLCTELID